LGGADNIAGWSQVHLSDSIEAACNLPVFVNNDANLMGLGEQTFGAASDCTDVLFITVGTGIGGAIIINNQLFGGYDNRGTELGHIPLFADGIPCSCGSVGCLEAYASTNALIQQFRERCNSMGILFQDEITGKLIIQLYLQNVPVAIESIHEHCRYLGHGIAGLVNIFSPQRVVIGGGISESGNFYIEKVNEYYQQYVMPDCGVNTHICAAALGNRAGMLGAAQWALTNY
jgi:glucokinase